MAEQQEDRNFFGRLKKLFSTTAIVRVDSDGKRKVVDVDERQVNTNLLQLKDRYTKLQRSFYETHSGAQSMAYHQVRRELFRDYDAMDSDPILASALDIYADECLGGDTIIPLLDGSKITIGELYKSGERDFWVYGLDKSGNFIPAKVDKVAYNGTKSVKKIILEDDTEIYATDDHIWVNGQSELVKTKELKIGDGLYTLSTKISNISNMSGYEQIQTSSKKYEFTHRIVGNSIPNLIEQKTDINRPVLHHKSFDKKNNDPNHLEYMEWDDHIKLHRDANLKMWEYRYNHTDKIKKIIQSIKNGHDRYWTDELKKTVSIRQKEFMKKFVSSLSNEERCIKWGRSGSRNGMYGKGYKLSGDKNGRWLSDVNRADLIDMDVVVDILYNHYNGGRDNAKSILKEHNIQLNNQQFNLLCNRICSEYKIRTIKQLKRKINYLKYNTLITNLRHATLSFDKNPLRNYTELCNDIGTTVKIMNDVLHEAGYKNFSDFTKSTNHRIKSISTESIEMDVYDLVNAGDNHIYAIETNDGGKLFTHNCTTKNEYGEVLQIKSSNENVKEILHNLFYDILNVEFNLWPWTRNLTKYGDFFLGLEIAEGKGVINVVPQSVYYAERLEGYDPNNANSVKFKVEQDRTGKIDWENYEMAHFRLLSDTNFLPYGKSMVESARRIWKQLTLMEDAMLIHRIMRAPEKRVFKIDIGNINPTEVDNYMQRIINKMKKVPFVDKNTGDYNLKYNMQNLTEDFFLPVRGGDSGTSIDNLGGLEYAATEDIEFLQKKLFAALKVPKAYLSYDENINGKATLAAEDVRFARTIERIQRTLVSELTKIAIVHLAAQGIDDSEMVNFELSLTNPSTIYEQEKVNLWSEKVRLASDMQALKMLSKDWVYSNLFGMSDADRDDEKVKLINDLKDSFRYNAIESDGNDPAAEKEPTKVEDELEELKKEISNRGSGGAQGGRPREGNTYGKDKHPYGRDPLGDKENHEERKRETFANKNSKKIAREYINGISSKKRIINEKKDFLDDKNLLDDDKI
jgi:hypothetical protein